MKKLLLFFLLSFSLIGLVYADNELSPSKEQCIDLFKNQNIINAEDYIDMITDAQNDVYDNRLYSYVSKSGSVAKNGPFGKWLYDEVDKITRAYRPEKFSKFRDVTWQDYIKLEQAVCKVNYKAGILREVAIAAQVVGASGWRGLGRPSGDPG